MDQMTEGIDCPALKKADRDAFPWPLCSKEPCRTHPCSQSIGFSNGIRTEFEPLPPQTLKNKRCQWTLFVLDLRFSLAHIITMQTVVETPSYLASASKLFSEEERADIVSLVAFAPECGDRMEGTGGFRKVRVARPGMGRARARA